MASGRSLGGCDDVESDMMKEEKNKKKAVRGRGD